MKKYKIAHIHVWDKNNKGDHAIVLAVQELLRFKFPGCDISDFPAETLKDYKLERIKKINLHDFVVIGGGGMLYSYFLPFNEKVINDINCPVFLFGLGYIKEVDAPVWSDDKIASVVSLARKASGIGVRDLNTKRFLIQNGLKPSLIKLVGDPAVFLSEKPISLVQEKKLNLSGEKIRIGLNLNYSGWLGFGKWREDILQAYRETAEYFQKKFGAEIYYLKHHPGEDNIFSELKIKDLRVVDLAPGEQKYVYSKMDMIIGMMLHVGVMSFGASCPEISVAYDIRNYGFAEFIGHPELVVDLDKLKSGELLKRAKLVFKDRKAYKKSFIVKKRGIFKKSDDFLTKIPSLL